MAAITYCNTTTDLHDAYSDIERYKRYETVDSTKWESTAGAVYKLDQSGYVEMVFDDGVEMEAEANETTTPAAGKFSYVSSSDTLYVRLSDDSNPANSTMEIGLNWDSLKSRMRNNAQELLEGMLKSVFAVPFQKITAPGQSYESRDYDYYIRRATALLTCSLIVRQINPDDPVAEKIYKEVDNPTPEVGERPGIVQRIKSGDIVLRTQRSARERGGYNVYEDANTGTTAYLEITGRYQGSFHQTWRIEIDDVSAGTSPGQATFRISYDQGGTWDKTGQATRTANSDDRRVYLGSGIYAEFIGTFAVGDRWDIDLFPYYDDAEVASVGLIRLER